MEMTAQEKLSAIRSVRTLARRLQDDHPEIAQMYRMGFPYPEIADALELRSQYGVKKSTATTVIGLAIRGYDQGYGIPSLNGLIDDLELSEIGREHQFVSATDNGTDTYQRGVGIHGMSSKKRRDLGLKTYGGRKGIAGMSHDERVRVGRGSGRKRAVMHGFVLWRDADGENELSEIDLLGYLSYSKSFMHPAGINKGKRNLVALANELNRVYHDGRVVRNRQAINCALTRFDKRSKT